MVRNGAGVVVAAGLIATGVALAVVPAPSEPPSPVVDRSDATPAPLVKPGELFEIYDDSMRQLRECIDDRRRDPSTSTGAFAC